MAKNKQLEAAFNDYETLGIDPDETMMIPPEVWASSQGLDPDDLVTYEEVDLDECKNQLLNISREIDNVSRDIEETKEMIKHEKNYLFKIDLQEDVRENSLRVQKLREEYQKVLAELEEYRSHRKASR